MQAISRAAQRSFIRGITLSALAAMLGHPASLLRAQSPQTAPRPNIPLPDEAAGVDAIVGTLLGAFDRVDVVALGEAHARKVDSDLRLALVRHPDFTKKVRVIVIECASTTEQSTLDRYIRGANVPKTQLERVWKTTTQAANGFCDAPAYTAFLATVRGVNAHLPAGRQIRVLGGDPGPGDGRSREDAAVSVLKEQVLAKHGKALIIYGAAHFYLAGPAEYLASMGDDVGMARKLDMNVPGRWLSVIPIGGLTRPPAVKGADIQPDYDKFDRALKAQVRPVLVPLHRLPFQDFTAEEFLGRSLTTCRDAGGCRSVFKGSTLTLGQMADAGIYVGRDADAAVRSKRVKFE